MHFEQAYIRNLRDRGSVNSQARESHRVPSSGSSTHLTTLITALATPRLVWRPAAHRNQHPALPAGLPLHHHGNRSLAHNPSQIFFLHSYISWRLVSSMTASHPTGVKALQGKVVAQCHVLIPPHKKSKKADENNSGQLCYNHFRTDLISKLP